ncbi:hypothetical protein RCO28_36665 [Streptomyces sp. LHD-70]|uniref:hypothetical protein n=1 Tax=Streptomyces sp. LHD-70 TaxID=3072140 RepID=UPI00280ECCFE|nr:hypothetical protein [Streptomyces sp. LHD-70]MDQ8707960.1 hypothetical protein [Streptomyces sp. LHD-70]
MPGRADEPGVGTHAERRLAVALAAGDQFRQGWGYHQLYLAVDGAGLWVSNGPGRKVIPWSGLAAVALHWSSADTPAGKDYSLEVCPVEPADPDDPVLGAFVKDDEPFRPDLPRLRYRFKANYPYRQDLIAAVRQYAQDLWAGETEREPGYLGRPVGEAQPERG